MKKLKLIFIFLLLSTFKLISQGYELWGAGADFSGQFGTGKQNSFIYVTKISSSNEYIDISIGVLHTIVLKYDGSLWGCGDNSYGQLGIGTTSNSKIFQSIGKDNDWKYISCGHNSSFAIKKDGSLWAWGDNSKGQLGIQDGGNNLIPNRVGNDNDWIKVVSGLNHTLGLKKDGSIWAWGDNSMGQLGNGSNIITKFPKRIDSTNVWKDIAAGTLHSVAIKNDGSLWTWGDNTKGQLGIGDTNLNYSFTPLRIINDNIWTKVFSYYNQNMAIVNGNGLWQWSENFYSQLGDSTRVNRSTPFKYLNENYWDITSASDHNTMGIKKDGTLWGIGCNSAYQLGIGNPDNIEIKMSFVPVTKDKDWQKVVVGFHYFLALKGRITVEATITTNKQNNEICIGDSIQLNAIVTQGVPEYRYKWTPSYLVSNDTIANPMAYPKKNTTFKVEITDSKDEKKTLSVNVIVNDYPVINIESIDTICQGDAFTATAVGGKEYRWYKDSVNKNILSTTNILTQKPTQNTKYIVEGNNYKCSSYDTINITVLPKPKAEIGLLGSLSLCQGDSVKLYIKDKLPSVNYEWIVNNTIVNTDTIIAKTPQKYKLIARNKTLNGCIDSTEIEVKEQAKEKLVINGIKSFCEGDSTKLEISKPYPGVQFEWNTSERTNSIIVNKAGTYWCKAINNNCLTADTIKVSINLKPVINITGDTTICKNKTGVLTLNGSYTSCTWSSGATTPNITITKAGIYSAQAENEFGCKSTAQIEVKEISNNIDLSKFQDIDFGKTKIYESFTKELDLTGINPSNIKLLNNTDFTFIRNGNKLEITCKAAKKGSSEDILFITIDKPCQETIALKLKAEAEGEQIITLKVADIEVLAGDTDVPLPITYKLNERVSLPQTITWTAKLNYKTAIYYPDIAGDVKSANRNIDISLSGTKTLTKKEDTLTIIRGNTYLADTIYTRVNFIDFTVNPDFTIIRDDGSIKITGLCVPNLRGIEFFTPTTMIIKPNPSNEEVDIEFTNEENGETKLKLFNSAGAEVLTDSKNKKDKTITFHFDKLDLPNGIYQAQIEQAGKILQSASLVIEK